VLRGLVVNLIVLVPFVLLLVALTIWLNGADIAGLVHANREVKVRLDIDPIVFDPEHPWTKRLATSYWATQTNEPYFNLPELVAGYGFGPPILITGLSDGAQLAPGGVPQRSPGEWLLQEPSEIAGFAVNLPDGDREASFVLRQASFDPRRPEAPRATVWTTGRLWITLLLGSALFAILATYPILQWIAASTRSSNWRVRNWASSGLAFLVALVLIVAVVETQPIAIYYYMTAWLRLRLGGDPPNLDLLVGLMSSGAVLIGAFSGRLAKYTHYVLARLGLFAIGTLGPFVLWLLYLVLGRWALCGLPHWLSLPQHWLTAGLTPVLALGDGLLGTRLAPLLGGRWEEPPDACFTPPAHGGLAGGTQTVLLVYLTLAVLLLIATTRLVDVNRTSLHQFYRDRLSKAFLLRRQGVEAEDAKRDAKGWRLSHNDAQTLETLGGPPHGRSRPALRFLRPFHRDGSAGRAPEVGVVAPYHLVNAALNTQSSAPSLGGFTPAPADAHEIRDVKGRKADFFLLSQHFVGSRLTGYCDTADMRALDPDLNLGTAMAISAAAAAPNMGTSTIKPLVFLMTVLNIRLGYWLPNPGLVAERKQSWGIRNGGHFNFLDRVLRLAVRRPGPIYLLFEMLGLLNAHSVFVNVSDGGHIENLGLYPLLQRRCRLIVAVDGERDPPDAAHRQKFSALATAIRYARIDLGIDVAIDLGRVGSDKDGRHFAIGRIEYGVGFPDGWLIYVKASLTGDENTYIREYGLDRAAFPHESTGDQFFDERQFECYRALGYHAMQDSCNRLRTARRRARSWPRGPRNRLRHRPRPA
jgi:hypothetical protein